MQNLFENLDMDAEILYGLLSSVCNDYLYIWDTRADQFQVSANTVSDFGFVESSMGHYCQTMLQKIHPRDHERFKRHFTDFWQTSETGFTLNYQMLNAAGAYIWVSNRGRARRDPQTGEPDMIIGTMKSLEECDYMDYVTGLLHHRFCQEKLQTILDVDPGLRFKLMLLGIDEFNKINTLNSRAFGDRVLRATAEKILQILPEEVNLYRYEGDQFLVVGAGVTREEMLQIYKHIQQYTLGAHQVDGQPYRFSVSAGMVSYPDDGGSWAELEKKAAVALKKAKINGKNQCVEFTHGMLREQIDEQFLTNCMAESVENGFEGFHLVFQPLCDAREFTIMGAEALLRYQMPDGRGISPVEFIPLLESSRLIIPVGRWVLEQAAAVCRDWVKWIPGFMMNVNVSYIQLKEPDFCQKAEGTLRRLGLASENLVLELTESYFMKEDANVEAALHRFRKQGIHLAMDDFGTGYSSLERLADLDVDIVKVDRFFVKALHTSQHNRDFIESVIRLCHNRRKKVCVEGVETREEWESIRLMNPDCIQGFYVSRPVDREFFFGHYVAVSFDGKSLAGTIDRDRLQEHLVNDRELLFAMMNATPLSLMIWNRQFEIMACNEEAVRLFGADSRRELIENFYSYSPPRQPDGEISESGARDRIYEAFLEGRTQFKWQHVDHRGRRLPVEVTGVRIPYQEDFVVASYARDLRSEIEVERSGSKCRKRMRAVMDATPLSCILWNVKEEILDCNQMAVEMFCADSADMVLSGFDSFLPQRQPDGRPSLEQKEAHFKEVHEKGRCIFDWMYENRWHEEIPCEVTMVQVDMKEDEDIIIAYSRDLRTPGEGKGHSR